MDDNLTKANSIHHVDDASAKSVHDAVTTPESLRHMTEEEIQRMDTKMVRKLDFVILPCMAVLYILNFIDRSALAAAKVYGITEDLNMSEQDFATAISILFVGYIPFQIPSNLIMTKITRPGFYICSAAVVWGCVSAATAAVRTYQALLAVRVFLGVTEAVFFPGVIYFLSAWYTKSELGKRLAGLFVAQTIGSAFGGFIAAACLTLDGRYGIEEGGYGRLTLFESSEGVVTVGCGLLFALIMPEYPHNARLLTIVERDYAVWRLEKEAGAGEANEDTSTLKGFILALKDLKIWTLVWCMFMSQAIGSSGNFFPSIVQTLGYDKNATLLLTAPPYIFAALVFLATSYYSDRKNAIYPMIVGSLAIAVVAYVICLGTLNTGARYFAMMLMPAVVALPQIMIYKTLNLHMARPYPKRSAGVAMVNALGGLSNLWASYLWYSPPHYYAAFGCLLGCVVVFFITITGYLWHVRNMNKLLGGTPEQQARAMKSGVTQQQIDLGWRYIGY